jgi:hypothetical protein
MVMNNKTIVDVLLGTLLIGALGFTAGRSTIKPTVVAPEYAVSMVLEERVRQLTLLRDRTKRYCKPREHRECGWLIASIEDDIEAARDTVERNR